MHSAGQLLLAVFALCFFSPTDVFGVRAERGQFENSGSVETSSNETSGSDTQPAWLTNMFGGTHKADLSSPVKVSNLNLFVCRRTPIHGYVSGGIFRSNTLENGYFEIRCSYRVNVLNRGLVGRSITGLNLDRMVKDIEQMKAMINADEPKHFPIKLKHCSRRGGCNHDVSADPAAHNPNEVVGGTDHISLRIPVPSSSVGELPQQSDNEVKKWALCYDDQDACDGVLWVPKNLHTCNGWFKGSDAEDYLHFVRDAVFSQAWSYLFHGASGPKDAQAQADLSAQELVSKEEVDDFGDMKSMNIAQLEAERDTEGDCQADEWSNRWGNKMKSAIMNAKQKIPVQMARREDIRQELKTLSEEPTKLSVFNSKIKKLASLTAQLDEERLPEFIKKQVQYRQKSENMYSKNLDCKGRKWPTLEEVDKNEAKRKAAQEALSRKQAEAKTARKAPKQKAEKEEAARKVRRLQRDLAEIEQAARHLEEMFDDTAVREDFETRSKCIDNSKQYFQYGEYTEAKKRGQDLLVEDGRVLMRCQAVCVEAQESLLNCGGTDAMCLGLRQDCSNFATLEGKSNCAEHENMRGNMVVAAREGGYNVNPLKDDELEMLEILFPPDYKDKRSPLQPYAYYWGGLPSFGYPFQPNANPAKWPEEDVEDASGVGIWAPGRKLVHGLGHLAYDTLQRLTQARPAVDAKLGGGDVKYDGKKSKATQGIAFMIIMIVGGDLYPGGYEGCEKLKEAEKKACTKWWGIGGRFRDKLKRWSKLWQAMEDNVYNKGGYLFFDIEMDNAVEANCPVKLQWGRKWAKRSQLRRKKKRFSKIS